MIPGDVRERELDKFREGLSGRTVVAVTYDSATPIPVLFDVEAVPLISNILLVLANTEDSFVIPSGTRKIMLKTREKAALLVSYTSGGAYFTLSPTAVYTEQGMLMTGLTVYFKSSLPNVTVEVLTWS